VAEDRARTFDQLHQQFAVGNRVRLTATGWTGTVAHVFHKPMAVFGEPVAEPELYGYDVVLDLDGSVTTLYDGLELLGEEEGDAKPRQAKRMRNSLREPRRKVGDNRAT
jgi:hypothetical protein